MQTGCQRLERSVDPVISSVAAMVSTQREERRLGVDFALAYHSQHDTAAAAVCARTRRGQGSPDCGAHLREYLPRPHQGASCRRPFEVSATSPPSSSPAWPCQ